MFFVRDPRDVVTQAYLDRVGRRRTLDQSLDDDVFDDDLIDREIDAFTAAATAANLGLVAELGNGLRSFLETAVDSETDVDATRAFASSLRFFAARSDENVRFVRFEDLLVASHAGFELLGRWFGLNERADVDAFADACVRAQTAIGRRTRPPRGPCRPARGAATSPRGTRRASTRRTARCARARVPRLRTSPSCGASSPDARESAR